MGGASSKKDAKAKDALQPEPEPKVGGVGVAAPLCPHGVAIKPKDFRKTLRR